VYFLLITYLTSSCEVRQIAKIPSLVEHYIAHKADNQNISVFGFLKMHYLDQQIVDDDFDEDMKLPFKTHDFSGTSITLNIPPEKTFVPIQYHLIYVDYSTNFSYSEKFYPSVFQVIWEPPKI
jgi:hypothetical protein